MTEKTGYVSGIFSLFQRYLKETIPLLCGIFSKENKIRNIEVTDEEYKITTEECHNLKENDDVILTNIYSIITSSHIKRYEKYYVVVTDQIYDFSFGLLIEDLEGRKFVVTTSPWISISNMEKTSEGLKIYVDNPELFVVDMVLKIRSNTMDELYDYSFDVLEIGEDYILVDFPFENLEISDTEGYLEIQNGDYYLFLQRIDGQEEDIETIKLKQKISLYFNGFYTVNKVLGDHLFSVLKRSGNLGEPLLNDYSCIRNENRILLDSGIENFIRATNIEGKGKANCKLVIVPDEGKVSYDRKNGSNDAIAVPYDGGDQYLTYVKNFTIYFIMEKQEAADFSREINIASNLLKFLNNIIMNYKFIPLVQNNTTSGVVFTEEGEFVDPNFKSQFGKSLYVHTYSYQYTEQYLLSNTLEQIDFDKLYGANNQFLTLQKIFDYLKLDTSIREFFDITVSDSRKDLSSSRIRRIDNNNDYKEVAIENGN